MHKCRNRPKMVPEVWEQMGHS
uniref:Uncharacterized protein n=1 Tax=Lepeophtheirus salmonis TaxID=72036 RepID=A0A0K2TIT1_LEPSM